MTCYNQRLGYLKWIFMCKTTGQFLNSPPPVPLKYIYCTLPVEKANMANWEVSRYWQTARN